MKYIISLIIGIALIGCGKGSQPLTADQKATVKDTSASISRSINAASSVGKSRKAIPEKSSTPDERQMKMQQRFSRYDRCDIQYNVKNVGKKSQLQDMDLDLKVSGDCPIELILNLKAKGNQQEASLDGKWFYSVKDEEYKSYNDVIGADIAGGGKVTAKDRNVDGKFTFAGEIVSQKHSKIKLEYELVMQGKQVGPESVEGQVSQSITLKYPDFTVEMKSISKMEANGTKTEEYLVNGEKVTQSEFQSYLAGGEIQSKLGVSRWLN